MFSFLGEYKSIQLKERELAFKLYSFESTTDFSSNDILLGQSIIFISDRYESEGTPCHHILYAACTNDLTKVGRLCDWTALSEKNANCIGVFLIERDINEEDMIAELLDTEFFSSVENIPIINSEELHFLQGNENYFEKVIADDKIQVVKDKIKEFFNMKNVNFLFGSGTSSPAIPVMKGLLKAICESELIDKEKEVFEKIAEVKKDNIEEILGTLYSQKAYLDGIGDRDSDDMKLCQGLIEKIENII